MCQNMKFATKFRVEPLLSNHVELDFVWIIFLLIFYKDIYVYLLAIGGYVCFSVCLSVIGVFHWGRCVGN